MIGYDRDNIDIDEISGGVVNFDGSLVISPKTASKSAFGAGSNNTAVFNIAITGTNLTNTYAIDFLDQQVSGNL
ncbi:spore germination protein [Neobacillus sp. WH10]|uniref:spore germination protein n=1 Tax=Neobacillus sp. WH10 TaxID=3047873 RepID=UPI0024C1CD4E|nr:spore germination protein [Neobacillus sp. WH10]WHY75156.1 spore germination protein [Neobacillus sp. WH10]